MPLNKERSYLVIPCHWNKDAIDDVLLNNDQPGSIPVREVYGVLADGGPIGHGRSRTSVVEISKGDAVEFRKYLGEKDLSFTYLLNAPFRFSKDTNHKQELNEYLDWVLGELQPDALMISSYELMQLVRSISTKIPIHVSTIAGVKTTKDLEKFMGVNPSKVVPHHDAGRRWGDLKDLVSFGKKNGVDCELMVTESCVFGCPIRTAHYEYLAGRNNDAPFHMTCNADKLIHPREFLLAGGAIRPEDLHIYEDIGINRFKITGRSKQAEWLPEVVKAYSNRVYDGNFIRLLGINPTMEAEDWIYLENRALDTFLRDFPKTGLYDDEVQYSNEWVNRLYLNGEFRLLDGSVYSVKDGELVIDGIGGNKASSIIRRERINK